MTIKVYCGGSDEAFVFNNIKQNEAGEALFAFATGKIFALNSVFCGKKYSYLFNPARVDAIVTDEDNDHDD